MTIQTPGPLQIESASGLAYRLMEPLPTAARRCLVLLHGVGSNELSVAALAEGAGTETLVVLVQGPLPLGPQQFAWFQVAFTATGPRIEATQAEHSRQALVKLLAHVQTQYAVPAQKTVLAGFSQGGIMSTSVALTSPETVAGFGLLCGRILPEIEPMLANKERLSSLQGFVGHGEFDSKLPVDWAHRAHDRLNQLGVRHTLALYPVDHSISAQMHADFMQWHRDLM